MPKVSLIIPCYNEERTIRLLLEAILVQTFPMVDMEVIIADGMSEDGTREEIRAFCGAHPELMVKIVDNPRRIIPAALNIAIHEASGEYIVRLDAHSKPDPQYIETSIWDLEEGKGTNVGGIWRIQPGGPGLIAKAISLAAGHPLGVGDALYRYATQASEVDTVPFGAFKRSLVSEIGGYDESLLTNEDYEFNTRIRQRGGKIWLDPRIQSVYFSRSTLGGLARQYWRYGYWKLRMLKQYPATLRWRQAIPPLFVLSLFILGLLSPFWNLARIALLIEVVLYIGALIGGSLVPAFKNKDFRLAFMIPVAIMTMHFCWGAGLLRSLITSDRK